VLLRCGSGVQTWTVKIHFHRVNSLNYVFSSLQAFQILADGERTYGFTAPVIIGRPESECDCMIAIRSGREFPVAEHESDDYSCTKNILRLADP